MVTFAHDRPIRLQDTRTGRCRAGLLTLFVVMLLSACTLQPIVPDTPTPAPEQKAAVAAQSAAATPLPTETPAPLSTAPSEPPRPQEILETISPAVAFVETATGAGTGLLIEGGYVVTSVHVVWPFEAAGILFPDGSVYPETPLAGWDLMTGLAVMGPLDTSIEPLAFKDGEHLHGLDGAYLIGYPHERERLPQPAISQTMVTRQIEWKPEGLTYFEIYPDPDSGQAGSALVSEYGEVVGIGGYKLTLGDRGLATFWSGIDILPHVQGLIAGEDPAGLGQRRLPPAGGALLYVLVLENYWDHHAYVIREPVGSDVELELKSSNDGMILVTDSISEEALLADEMTSGIEEGILTIEYEEPYFLSIWQFDQRPGTFTLRSSRRLTTLQDPDDGRKIGVGESLRANIDFPADVDHFVLRLKKGETIEVVTRSAMADTLLFVDFEGTAPEFAASDDNSGGGLFWQDSRIVYRARYSGTYLLVVQDAQSSAPGGYVISVEKAPAGAVPVQTTARPVTDLPEETEPAEESSPRFGGEEIRAALDQLLTSFIEVDPELMRVPTEFSSRGIEFNEVVVYVNTGVIQVVVATATELTDEQLAGFRETATTGANAAEVMKSIIGAEAILEEKETELHRIGMMEMDGVGEELFGLEMEYSQEGFRQLAEVLFFNRGNLVTLVLSTGEVGAGVTIPVKEIAQALDEKMLAYQEENAGAPDADAEGVRN